MRWPLCGFVLEYVRARGGDAEALRRRFGIARDRGEPGDASDTRGTRDGGDGGDATLTLPRFVAFTDAAAVAARDPSLGVSLARALPRGPLGLLEFTATSAPTVGEGLRRVGRFCALVHAAAEVALVEEELEARLEHALPGEPGAFGRHANEFFVAYVLLQMRRATGDACVPSRAWFAHARPDDVGALVDAVGTDRLAFGCEGNGFAISRALLDRPLVRADAPLSDWLDAKARAALADRDAAGDLLARLRRTLRARLAGGAPTIAATARTLGMSPRTLQRRLQAEATSFQALVESVRADLALHHVRDGVRGVGEIASLCGYSEPSAFLRAFKRWTGSTPTELRAAIN